MGHPFAKCSRTEKLRRIARCLRQIARGIENPEQALDRNESLNVSICDAAGIDKSLSGVREQVQDWADWVYKLLATTPILPPGAKEAQLRDAIGHIRTTPAEKCDIQYLAPILDNAASVIRHRKTETAKIDNMPPRPKNVGISLHTELVTIVRSFGGRWFSTNDLWKEAQDNDPHPATVRKWCQRMPGWLQHEGGGRGSRYRQQSD